MTNIDPKELRKAFGCFATGVTVVTSYDGEQAPIGFTANSFSSVSMDPPMVSVCLANSSKNYANFKHAGHFAVNILTELQIDIANTFARPVEDRFAQVGWRKGTAGSPILNDVSAWFDCSTHSIIPAGDHIILLGEVQDFQSTDAPGLGFVRGSFSSPTNDAEALSRRGDLVVSALIHQNEKLLLVDDGAGGLTLPMRAVASEGAHAAVTNLIKSCGAEISAQFIYSVFEDNEQKHNHIAFVCEATQIEPTETKLHVVDLTLLSRIADPAIRTMVERFYTETKLGNYGIYFGDKNQGNVRPIG